MSLRSLLCLFLSGRLRPVLLYSHALNMDVQLSNGVRCPDFGLNLNLHDNFVRASSIGSGETAWIRSVVFAYAASICLVWFDTFSHVRTSLPGLSQY